MAIFWLICAGDQAETLFTEKSDVRGVAAGARLLANQQTAIFHPFTLVGLPLLSARPSRCRRRCDSYQRKRVVLAAPRPARMVAWGWSFLPEMPGFYGIEDVKATDPLQHFGSMFMLRGYLDVVPAVAGGAGMVLLMIVLAVLRRSPLAHESQLPQQELEVLAAEP